MKLDSEQFGQIDIDETQIINFPSGLLAFEDYKRFIIVDDDRNAPFKWLQSIDDKSLTFVIINPFIFKKGYEFDIPDSAIQKLKIENERDVAVYSIVVVNEDINKMTANLSGPIIINTNARLGKQLVLDDNRYSTKHLILKELQNEGQEA